MSVQESLAEAWVGSGAGLGALNAAVHAWDLLKEVAIIFINLTKVSGQTTGREHSPAHLQKIG